MACKTFKQNYNTFFTFGGFRETGKHYVIMTVDLFRQKALGIGAVFVAQGRLDEPEHIFDLSVADIDEAKTNLSLDLRVLGKQRTAFSARLRKSHFVVRIIDSRGKIFFPPAREAANGGIAGNPISPGTVRGRAKVLHHAAEKQLLPGEILVARATDPGWTPLFINAGGIVLEIGGTLQHGAIVAREYGIPCVSGITGAVDIIRDGQFLEVDGSNGIVRLLDEYDEESLT
jgi:pyruvate,water dikinase